MSLSVSRNFQSPERAPPGCVPASSVVLAGSRTNPVARLNWLRAQRCAYSKRPEVGKGPSENAGRATPKRSVPPRLALTLCRRQRPLTRDRPSPAPLFSSLKSQPCALGVTDVSRTSPRVPGSKPYPVATHARPQRMRTVVPAPAGTATGCLRVLTRSRAPDTPAGSRSRTQRSTARTPRLLAPPAALRRKRQSPAATPGIERRTVTPAPRSVTAAFSATAEVGQRSVSVLDPPAGTVVEPATELGTTTSAARALAGTASRAIVSEAHGANLSPVCASRPRFYAGRRDGLATADSRSGRLRQRRVRRRRWWWRGRRLRGRLVGQRRGRSARGGRGVRPLRHLPSLPRDSLPSLPAQAPRARPRGAHGVGGGGRGRRVLRLGGARAPRGRPLPRRADGVGRPRPRGPRPADRP